MNARKMIAAAVAVIVAAIAVWLLPSGGRVERQGEQRAATRESMSKARGGDVSAEAASGEVSQPAGAESQTGESESQDEEEPQTEEERREAEEEKLVNAFDDLTDKWMEPAKNGVTMADVDSFAKQFRQVPKARKDECIHRALNLIPDENVMLLAGVLMDKTMDKEIVETVFNDVLNRDEDVKKPILQQIFKDKSHPCWADVAWILDVTGELPKAK